MKTKIFTFEGHLGAETDLRDGKFLNDPMAAGQLGCVISTSEIQITQEAIDLIKKAPREGGSFAEIMLTPKHDGAIVDKNEKSAIGLMGFGKMYFGTGFKISRDCDTDILNDCEIVEMEVPDDFKEFITNKILPRQ